MPHISNITQKSITLTIRQLKAISVVVKYDIMMILGIENFKKKLTVLRRIGNILESVGTRLCSMYVSNKIERQPHDENVFTLFSQPTKIWVPVKCETK